MTYGSKLGLYYGIIKYRRVWKKETVSFKEEILLSSTLEAKFTVNLHKDDIKIENTGIQGKN